MVDYLFSELHLKFHSLHKAAFCTFSRKHNVEKTLHNTGGRCWGCARM